LIKKKEKTYYVTFLAGAFRSIRFGLEEAHGKGQALQLNFLLEKGAFYMDENGRYGVDFDKVSGAVEELANKIMVIQAEGDKESAKLLFDTYGKKTESLDQTLKKLIDLPTDIFPQFSNLKEINTN